MITVTHTGITRKHPDPARVGDLWMPFNASSSVMVSVTETNSDYGYGPLYVTLLPMHPNGLEFNMSASDFYAAYYKVGCPVNG